MKISEIFYSIQGEGGLVGMPSVFIRTSGCNLRCSWCDTPYTSWNPEGGNMSLREIESAVERFPARHAVVTGGEPMIAPEIVALTKALKARGLHITIETAGTVDAPVACDLMSLSPKLSSSTPYEREQGRWAVHHERLRYQPEVLRQFLSRYICQLKFVVCHSEDLHEIQQITEDLGVSRSDVFLMPEGTQREALRERALWLTEVCKAEGFRFSPRLHVDLWGDRRGV